MNTIPRIVFVYSGNAGKAKVQDIRQALQNEAAPWLENRLLVCLPSARKQTLVTHAIVFVTKEVFSDPATADTLNELCDRSASSGNQSLRVILVMETDARHSGMTDEELMKIAGNVESLESRGFSKECSQLLVKATAVRVPYRAQRNPYRYMSLRLLMRRIVDDLGDDT